ncbi:squalene/phytoene synthase family protein [Methylophilaceae bacterium]|jgi:hydroxysqualene synthase|nr:squalene/phytoene synthase family protein [Methylophilaceae bacterium]
MSHYITLKAGKERKKHYENFPVATLLYPKKIREAVIIFYQFARIGDDIADEGIFSKKQRLKKLQIYQKNLNKIKKNNLNVNSLFLDIYQIINQYQISTNLLQKFIDAFKQDIINNRYNNFNELINYLNKAAAPAGQIILRLFKEDSKQNIIYSNSICQAFALIGISQDFYEDILKDRLYIPKSEMKKFNLNISDIHEKKFNANWKLFKASWLKQIEIILSEGKPLISNTNGRLRLQIKIMIGAVNLLISRMKNEECDLFINPPKLSKIDWLVLFYRCILTK